ncbi:MAG: 50S ribosomal protein L29 [Bacteroidia bacterium]
MKQNEIAQMSITDLSARIVEESGVLAKLELNHAVSPIENPMKIRITRRVIARLKTELRKREIETAKKN